MRSRKPAKFGPYHRRSAAFPDENEKVCSSGQIWGKPRGQYGGDIPSVKAWDEELPRGIVGVEFFTDVEPDPWGVPGWPEWTQGRPGVIILVKNQLVAIPVVVTKRHDAEKE